MGIRNIVAVSAFSFSAYLAFPQASVSAQAHLSAVTGLAAEGGSVFSAGGDGFLVRWADDDMGEHFQVSALGIRLLARSPDGNDVAVYETDGGAAGRVSVWDWRSRERRFAVDVPSSVTSLSYSAKGTFLLCGTAGAEGALVLGASSGEVVPGKLGDGAGAVGFIATSGTENTAVTYSPDGALSYYDLASGGRKARFGTEAGLSEVTMFDRSLFLAGKKDGRIVVVHGTSGKTVASFSAAGAVLLDSSAKDRLYYVVGGSGQFSVFSARGGDGAAPEKVRTFSGLAEGERITAAAFSGEFIYAGTSAGNIYKVGFVPQERVDSVLPITESGRCLVTDVAAADGGFYFLTADALYRGAGTDVAELLCRSEGFTDVAPCRGGVVLWSRGTRRPPVLLGVPSGERRTLFTPGGALQRLRVFGDALLVVESGSNVVSYDIASGRREVLYGGAGIQDALLLGGTDLYVAKTKSTAPASPLILVNTRTRETVPLDVPHEIVCSLAADMADARKIYGVALGAGADGSPSTSVFEYSAQGLARSLLSVPEEDGDALLCLDSSVLHTNLGKGALRSLDLSTGRCIPFGRSASLPLKAAAGDGRVAVLNRDGSVSWLGAAGAGALAEWRLSADGSWAAF